MAGVARPWEAAVDGAKADRLVVMRTGIVLDHGMPAFERLAHLTKLGLGGRISRGDQWISWIHIDDFLRAVQFIRDHDQMLGTVHVTAPEPIQNKDMMASLRSLLHRPWSPPTPRPLVHLGARVMRTDPALALTGRRCVPRRLLEAGFEFQHPTFESAMQALLAGRADERW
jgi:NAD dependent epimerase/dehydratase family enzyme